MITKKTFYLENMHIFTVLYSIMLPWGEYTQISLERDIAAESNDPFGFSGAI